jgi:hypothetical protein
MLTPDPLRLLSLPAPLTALLTALLTATLPAQNHLVVPAAFTTTDAMSYEWIAGASHARRQQTLIGQSHLTALVGRQIQALELRRTAVDEPYAAGAANLTIQLSTSPHAPALCSNEFAANVGNNAQQVFAGTIALPASPAISSGTGATVQWTAANTVRIAFAQPFAYQGGTLCIDVTGQPIAGQKTWWMADAIEDVVPGTAVVELGPGCGAYGGPQRQWSFVAERSLVPGGHAIFRAEGPPNGLALCLFGAEAAPPVFPQYPLLSQWGIPTAGCRSYINPFLIMAVVPAVYCPQPAPAPAYRGIAEVLVRLPADPSWFGFTLTTQWFDLGQLAASNGFRWTVASAAPTLDMALCEGHPLSTKGNVTNYLAHVVRFEYQ